MNKGNYEYLVILCYLIAFSGITDARRDDDDWTVGDVLKYGAMAVVGGVGAVVAAPAVLTAAGFAATGITAGSLAAVTQAGIGNVVGGSVFAALQSAGVAGLGGTAAAAVGTGGAAVGAMTAKATDKKETN